MKLAAGAVAPRHAHDTAPRAVGSSPVARSPALVFAALALLTARCDRASPPRGPHLRGALPRSSLSPLVATAPGERIDAPGLTLETVHRFADHERGRVACQYDPLRRGVACVTDLRSRDWHRKGVRVVRVDPARSSIEEHVVAPHFHGSFLWGDFNRDGAPDFAGFSDELDDPEPRVAVYLGTRDPWVFRETHPIAIDHPVLGGAVIDADGDGCEDLLALGTGYEFTRGRPVTYFADALFRGDCRGGFAIANAAFGLDHVPDFVGSPASPRLGRVAAVTDLDDDGRSDLVVGNYRTHPDTFLRSDGRGRFVAWEHNPDRDPGRAYFGHAVGLSPFDLEGRGRLDLVVFNLWHNDERGRVTDPSYVLRGTGAGVERRPIPQGVEAPFGGVATDFDGDGSAEVLIATAHRGEPYEGRAVLLRKGSLAWRDAEGWLRFRETPAVVDLDLDGAPDLVGDGRVLAQRAPASRAWVGFVFTGRPLAGCTMVFEAEGGVRRAFSLASDGRGQPGNLLTVGLLGGLRPLRLYVREAVGRAFCVDLRGISPRRYHVIDVPDAHR